jgi:hypothetical protein
MGAYFPTAREAVWNLLKKIFGYVSARSRLFTYSAVLTLGLGIPVFRYYTVIPGTNACVVEYVDSMEKSHYEGYLYDIEGQRHIEPLDSNRNDALEEYRIGRSYGCVMASNNLYYDLSNTVYCSVAYLLENSPLRNSAIEAARHGPRAN